MYVLIIVSIINSNDEENDITDPEGYVHELDSIGANSSIKEENVGFKLKDFR